MQARSTRGATAELAVAVDLMRRGFHVFRSESAHAPCDLIALDGDRLVRIEVRSATERANGTLSPNMKPTDRCDIYAFVCGDRIEYADPEDARAHTWQNGWTRAEREANGGYTPLDLRPQ